MDFSKGKRNQREEEEEKGAQAIISCNGVKMPFAGGSKAVSSGSVLKENPEINAAV